ncbi:hypothetical protein E2C01_037368 [Portunus trituberculatus]|uniref:Uncharacterized protein n=1 Tax=Portunus trituberculatus TaxID=210409 RepID=A0A5B7FEG2_PORTR|nr:hypothetical protein [Portunus trituberculatus]
MLPQDTCGMLPWRMTMPVLQVFGCLPYKLSATSDPPVFSLPLLLWSISVHVFLTSVSFFAFTNIFHLYAAPDLGTVFFMNCVAFMMATVPLFPVSLTIKSSKMAALLHDMSNIVVVHRKHKIYPKNLIVMMTAVIFVVFSTWFACFILRSVFFECVMVFLWTLACSVTIFMPDSCLSALLDLMTSYLLLATESTVATVSKLLGPDGSFSGEDNTKEALLALHDLESLIREVTAWQETVKQCFFPVLTTFLLLSVMLAIACPYAILKGKFMGGTTIVCFLFSFYIMGVYSYYGQIFTDKVGRAAGRQTGSGGTSSHALMIRRGVGVDSLYRLWNTDEKSGFLSHAPPREGPAECCNADPGWLDPGRAGGGREGREGREERQRRARESRRAAGGRGGSEGG